MAEHAEVQYATAEGNDLPAHEAGFSQFVQVVFIGTAMVINILFGLAIGGVIGHWLPACLMLIGRGGVASSRRWSAWRVVRCEIGAISALLLL